MHTLEITLTPHCISRFQERVRPTLGIEAAGDELARLVLAARIADEAPDWLAVRQAQVSDAYMVIGDVVLPLRRARDDSFAAVTCLVRGGLSSEARARRNAHRRRRARFRQAT